MPVYECVVYERPKFGDPQPVVVDGQVWSREVVAERAAKARYSFWLSVHEWNDEVRIIDIRVRSLRGKKAEPMADGWESRLETANAIIGVIASHGRRFFSQNADRRTTCVENPFIARFQVDTRGELWFVDSYTRRLVLVRHSKWPGFSSGGTLRAIVEHLAEFIKAAKPVNIDYFSPSPQRVCNGDLWGYGTDMLKVRDEVQQLISTKNEEVPMHM